MISFILVVKYVVLTSIAIFCVVFLATATAHQSKYGPQRNPLAIRVTSLEINIKPIEEINIKPIEDEYIATNFPLEWKAEFTIANTKSYLEHVVIMPFESFITYKGVAFSCGYMNNTQKIPKRQDRKVEVKYTSDACEMKSNFVKSTVSNDFLTEMKKGEMNVSVTMNLRAYYKHDKFWGWDVWLLPQCENLGIEYRNGLGTFEGGGADNCVIPPPERYI